MSAEIELGHYHERSFQSIGARAFNHDVASHTATEYEALREKGRAEVQLRQNCMKRAHEAYERGDGATAKQLSNEGKQHGSEADAWFKQASKLAFETNNASAGPDSIDLHGQYVSEAEELLTNRIRDDQRKGRVHLHVIVGKGNHSVDHVQKLKPAVEKLCQDLGLRYATEENAGRIYVNLQGDDVTEMPPSPPQYGGHQHRPHQDYGDQQQHYPGQQQHHGGQNQGEQPSDEMETLLTTLFKKICCTVM